MFPSNMDVRFVCLVVLAVVSLAASAPVAQEVKLEKRAQEVISYGNQQNAPRLKKRDPALAEGKSDVDSNGKVKAALAEAAKAEESQSGEASQQDSGEADAVASIKAAAAESTDAASSSQQNAVGDVPEVEDDSSAEEPTNMAAFEESMMGENAAQADNELPGDSPASPSSGDDVDDLLSQLKSEAETAEKEEQDGKKEENETTALASPEDLDQDYQNYFTNYNLLRKYNSLMGGGQGYRAQYPGYTQYYRRRRSALAKLRRARRLAPHGRRIKRDLLDDSQYVYLPYGVPPQYLSQAAFPQDLYPEQWDQRPDPEEQQREEILAELMAMKEEEEREEEEEEKEKEMLDLYSLLYGGGYGEYVPYLEEEQEPELEQEEEYPVYKRQLLSEMPGLKKRYFFPYAQEPQTHWPAFVPQKRQHDEYGDAYAQVMRLAQELALEEPRDGYLDNYFDGEKKK